MFGVKITKKIILVANHPGSKEIQAALNVRRHEVLMVPDVREISTLDINRSYGLVVCNDRPQHLDATLDRLCQMLDQANRPVKRPLNVCLLNFTLSTDGDEYDRWQRQLGASVAFRTMSLPGRAARSLFQRFPLHLGVDIVFGQPNNLLIVGFREYGQAIAVHAMRLAQYGLDKLTITVVVSDPKHCKSSFFDAFPQLQNVADVRFVELDELIFEQQRPFTFVFVCEDTDRATAGRAVEVRDLIHCEQRQSPPIIMNLSHFDHSGSVGEWDGLRFPWSAIHEVCIPAILFGFEGDRLASIIHDYYRDSIESQGRSLESTPAGESWENLNDSYRQASRHQADHIPAKLACIDCFVVLESESDYFAFTSSEVEQLSRIEHARWSADRYLDGWQYGPSRDNRAKIHPELIPYDDLTNDMKDLDRYAVRLIPALLARQGKSVIRGLNLVSVVEPGIARPDSRIDRSIREILSRLQQRFPNRSLVLSCDLEEPIQRLLARYATEEFSIRLRVILRRPIQDILNTLRSNELRSEYLDLLARCERRIRIIDNAESIKWIAQRAQILLVVAGNPAEYDPNDQSVRNSSEAIDLNAIVRRRVLLTGSGRTDWTFEY